MTFRSLALSGIRGNWRAYSAFFLSSVFSVVIFYMYAAFLFHPDVVNGHIHQADKVKTGMKACEYIIVVFSFFFVMYANSAFLKTRQKEFGLFTLFGMTGSQLRRLLMIESVIIALLAIASGLGIGLLLSKLFFMALASLLAVDAPIRFAVPGKAVLLTSGGYFILFNALSWLAGMRAGRQQIVDLLKEASKPKKLPAYSVWLSLLAAVCLGGGYLFSYVMDTGSVIVLALPVIGLVTVGTYFLFTQGSVAVIRALQRSRSLFYRRTNMLVLSQLAFKLRDNARIYFVVSIMSAVVLTASGTFYVIQLGSKEQLLEHMPQTVGFAVQGPAKEAGFEPDTIRRIIADDGFKLKYETQVVGLPTDSVEMIKDGKASHGMRLAVISEADYNKTAKLVGKKPMKLESGSGAVVYPYVEMKSQHKESEGSRIRVGLNGETFELALAPPVFGALLAPVGAFTDLLVVDDETYRKELAGTPEAKRVTNYGFELENWTKAFSTVRKIEKAVPENDSIHRQTYRVEDYITMKTSMALTMFIGLFISLLFFIATGSVLYFKQFTEMKDDEAQFRALKRIGMTAGEIRRIAAVQLGIMFFVPLAVGIVHTLFAMIALGHLLHSDVWLYAGVVVAIYVVMQGLYFAAAYNTYSKRMLKAAI